MAGEENDREPREVKNHILFEIATEVAHRDKQMQYRLLYPMRNRLTSFRPQSEAYIL